MKKEIGLWIDHREAVIVTLQDKAEDIQRLESDVESRGRFSSGVKGVGEDIRDRRIEGHLEQFYDAVIAHLQDATAVLIMGPGEAKTEFHKHMEKRLPETKIVNVEAADKMTDPQIVAKVRRNFELYQYTH